MKLKWKRPKERTWPTVIHGWPARPRNGACPGCGVPKHTWCETDCTLLDPMDYR